MQVLINIVLDEGKKSKSGEIDDTYRLELFCTYNTLCLRSLVN